MQLSIAQWSKFSMHSVQSQVHGGSPMQSASLRGQKPKRSPNSKDKEEQESKSMRNVMLKVIQNNPAKLH